MQTWLSRVEWGSELNQMQRIISLKISSNSACRVDRFSRARATFTDLKSRLAWQPRHLEMARNPAPSHLKHTNTQLSQNRFPPALQLSAYPPLSQNGASQVSCRQEGEESHQRERDQRQGGQATSAWLPPLQERNAERHTKGPGEGRVSMPLKTQVMPRTHAGTDTNW